MDDSTFHLLYVLVGVAAVALVLAALTHTTPDPLFWGFLTAIVGLITAVQTRRKNDNGNGKEK